MRQALKLNPDYIAMLDDDEYPDEDWILELYTRLKESGADVVTGPLFSEFVDLEFKPLKVPFWIKNNSRFDGKLRRADGAVCKTASTNNVLFKRSILDKMDFWFDERYLKMTGEDIDFFDRVYALGYKIVWCKKAALHEIVDIKRCNLKFIWNRNYNNGYLKIFNKKKKKRLSPVHYFLSFFDLVFFTVLFPLSIVCGLTIFVEAFGKIAFSLGAVKSLFASGAIEHYKN